ncbi:MAG TPA: YigZ family protein [Methanosarcinaceae archaeon]|nr:YigZ family protein [Methanosarcinaceae archaeon]
MTTHKTLKSPGEAKKEFKNSTFTGHARPVKNENEAKEFIKQIKERHNDADHNVSAYLIKNNNELAMKYADDGEPAGSSGKPIFKMLELNGIQNAVVVVTRYFGGTKLGFGGLARAYRETAVAAIENAGIIEVHETVNLNIYFGYPQAQKIKNLILVKDYGNITAEKYSDAVEFTLEIIKEKENEFIGNLSDLTKNKVKIEYQS